MIRLKFIDTPVGKMRLGATDKGLCLFEFEYRKSIDNIMKRIHTQSGQELEEGDHPLFPQAEQEVNEYFTGQRKDFTIPLDLLGTPFQLRVWQSLLTIPYGETRSYKQQSLAIGDEKAIRAMASANGENGLAIIVPCHRVIGTNGSLTGYGGGLPKKKWLLDHERKHSGKTGQAELF